MKTLVANNNFLYSRTYMHFVSSISFMLFITFFPSDGFAGVYKCIDQQGKTAYQASPCMNNNTDLSAQLKEQEKNIKLQQQQSESQKKLDKEANRLQEAAEQQALNQQLVKNNPAQYTAFAIPPYLANNLPQLVKQYESRLPSIEKLRRLAAHKALASGECTRVEADELSIKSTANELVFSVDCSSAKTFFYTETELTSP